MKKSIKDSTIIGFALFSMFFGAGNLIFPAFLGNKFGSHYLISMLGFLITGVGLPLLAIIACSKVDGTFESIASKVSNKFAIIFTTILFIAIGPILAIPRTAATTFELTIQPFFPELSPFICITIYFVINLFFILRKSSVIDTLGKYLTPALMIILSILIFKGIFIPIGPLSTHEVSNVFSSSLIEGYQTMDAIAALLFASLITNSIKSKGYSTQETLPMILKSSFIAIVGLASIYGGLIFIGAHTRELAPEVTSKTSLLILVSKNILGNLGPALIGIAMGLACLTTSIGLITAGANFFDKISKGKLPFKVNAIVISIISLFIACLGVDKIIGISGPILDILYPVAITLIFITLFNKYINNRKVIQLTVYTSLLFGILSIIPNLDLSFIPLATLGFAWLTPTVIILILSSLIIKE